MSLFLASCQNCGNSYTTDFILYLAIHLSCDTTMAVDDFYARLILTEIHLCDTVLSVKVEVDAFAIKKICCSNFSDEYSFVKKSTLLPF